MTPNKQSLTMFKWFCAAVFIGSILLTAMIYNSTDMRLGGAVIVWFILMGIGIFLIYWVAHFSDKWAIRGLAKGNVRGDAIKELLQSEITRLNNYLILQNPNVTPVDIVTNSDIIKDFGLTQDEYDRFTTPTAKMDTFAWPRVYRALLDAFAVKYPDLLPALQKIGHARKAMHTCFADYRASLPTMPGTSIDADRFLYAFQYKEHLGALGKKDEEVAVIKRLDAVAADRAPKIRVAVDNYRSTLESLIAALPPDKEQ